MLRQARRRPSFSRARSEWASRIGLAALAIVLGYMSVTQSLAYVLGKLSPERGYAVSSSDGRIAGLLAEKLSGEGASSAIRLRAGRIARKALEAEPINVPALAVLGLNAAIAGNPALAQQLFARSNQLSRRHLPTRLWLIEDAVQRNDISGAIRNYDIALRTSRSASDRLFPILANAVEDQAIAAVLVRTLKQQPPWGEPFIQYLSSQGSNPKITAGFFQRLASNKVGVADEATSSVVNALVAANQFNDAWNYYQTLRPHVDRRRSRDPDFATQLASPTAFDWVPRTSETGITSSIQRNGTKTIFDFSAPSTVGGTVLEQLQLLPTGRYRLTGRTGGIDQPADARPYWQLVCTDGRELGRVEIPNSIFDQGRFQGVLTVGADCKAQILRLVLRSSNQVSGVSGQIDNASIAPL